MSERGAVILIENGELILIERVRGGRTYYLFPGGGVEAKETRQQAAVREAYEEVGLHVRIGRLVAVVTHAGSRQYYFLATVTGGQFGTGAGPEMGSTVDSPEGSYKPVRLQIRDLQNYDVRPRALAELVSSTLSWENVPVLHADD